VADRPPLGAPLARPLALAGAANVIHRAATSAEQAEELLEHGLVVRAAGAARGAVERGGARDLEGEIRAAAPHFPVQESRGDALHVAQRDWTGEDGREERDHLARGGRNAQIRLERQVAAGGAEDGLRIGAASDETGE